MTAPMFREMTEEEYARMKADVDEAMNTDHINGRAYLAGRLMEEYRRAEAESERADKFAALLIYASVHIRWLHTCIEDELTTEQALDHDTVLADITRALVEHREHRAAVEGAER